MSLKKIRLGGLGLWGNLIISYLRVVFDLTFQTVKDFCSYIFRKDFSSDHVLTYDQRSPSA